MGGDAARSPLTRAPAADTVHVPLDRRTLEGRLTASQSRFATSDTDLKIRTHPG